MVGWIHPMFRLEAFSPPKFLCIRILPLHQNSSALECFDCQGCLRQIPVISSHRYPIDWSTHHGSNNNSR